MDFLKKAQAALGQQGQHQNTEGNQAPAEGQMKQGQYRRLYETIPLM